MVAGPRARAAWRVFDAQYFDLAQQRARLFVVVDFGDGADPAEVLFERKSLRRDTAPRRKTGEIVAALTARGVGTCGAADNQAQAGHLIAAWAIQERAVSENPAAGPDGAGFREGLAYTLEARSVPQSVAFGGNNCSGPIEVSPALTAHAGPCGRMDFESEAFIAEVAGTLSACSFTGGMGGRPDSAGAGHLIAFDCKSSDPARGVTGDKFTTLRAMASKTSHQNGGGHLAVAGESGVRRLTPRECERLQGFPDDYTLIPWRKGHAPDGLRYRALGNSMPVPVMRWIGARLAAAMPGRAA
jgi:DNA (cytosine-5)-methyltransferase 1